MADQHQSTRPPGAPYAVPPWATPPLRTPAASLAGLPPLPPPPPLQTHPPQYLMHPPPPFFPFPPGHPGNPGIHGNPGFVHGFAQQQQQQQHHYYNVGPRPFPFHSPPPNQGSFGSPPPFLPPPPQRAPHQMVSGVGSFIQTSDGGAAHFRGGNAADFGQYNRTSQLGIARSDNLGLSKEDEGITVIEKAIKQTEKENTVDVKELLSQIRALVGQAEEAVQKVGKLGMLEPSTLEPHLVTCPYNPTHRVSPKVLFKHFLCCPSNPKPQVDAEKLISSLQYPHWQDDDEDSGPEKDDHKSVELQYGVLDDGRKTKSSVEFGENLTKGEVQVEKGNVKDQIPASGCGNGDGRKASLGSEIDIWGGRFFYKDSAAVVQAPLPTPYPATEMSGNHLTSNPSADRLGTKLESISSTWSIPSVGGIGSIFKKGTSGDGLGPLLPSRFWFLLRETETWKELPTRCSTLVLQAAAGVGRIRRKVVSEWVLVQGPAHGVVIDSAMASHIHSLARICLKSLQTEASTLIDNPCDFVIKSGSLPSPEKEPSPAKFGTDDRKEFNGNDASALTKVKEEPIAVLRDIGRSVNVSLLDCPHLFQSGHWLASQLSSLFGPLQSKAFVLKLLQHCLVMSGRILASSFIGAFKKQANEDPVCRSLRNEGGGVKPSTELQILEDVRQIDSELVNSMDETVDGRAPPVEVVTAIAAVRERAVLESYLRTLSYPSLAVKFQMIQEHEATVMMAAAERRKRVNYRAVVEHDGLIWHRSQLEEKNKNKTREEILAEERDYKRRRTSYRGKKLKRNPTEVLRDLIGGHMEEIVEAGGIGCLVKHTGGVALSAEAGGVDSSQRSNLSNVDNLIHPNLPDVEPPILKSHPMHFNTMDNSGNWSGPSSGRPGRRDDRSSEQSRSRTAELDVDDAGAGSQDNRDPEMEDRGTHHDYKKSKYRSDGLRGKFDRHNSHHSSYSGKDDQSFHSRSERDDGTDSKKYWVENSADRSTTDYRRDRSRSQRYSESREGSNEEDGYDRRHTREFRGKSRSSH